MRMFTELLHYAIKFLVLASNSTSFWFFQMWMNVQVEMSATRTPSVQTRMVATRAVVLTVTREMEGTAQVSASLPLA